MQDFNLKKIVVATDFSDAAKKAEKYAIGMAKHLGVSLEVVHVFEKEALVPILPYHTFDHSEVDKFIASGREKAQETLDNFCKETGVECTGKLLEGKPGPAVAEYSKNNNLDMLILGTHGYTGVSWLLMGSVAEYIISHCDCPVLTIKSK